MQVLSLRFTNDEDGDTQLRATIETPDFKGTGYYWFPARELQTFCNALSRYPIPLGESVSGSWYDAKIVIQVTPSNGSGDLIVRIRIADFTNDWNVCQVLVPAHYADIKNFRDELQAVIAAGEGEATLRA